VVVAPDMVSVVLVVAELQVIVELVEGHKVQVVPVQLQEMVIQELTVSHS
jgi:hypothetical protein